MRDRHADLSHARDVLASTAPFRGLAPATLDAVAGAMELLQLPGGERLFAQGDEGDAAYLVLGGRLRVDRVRDGRYEVVRELGRGELVGELSLLTGSPRAASIRAVRDSELGRMPSERFIGLLAVHPDLGLQISRRLAALLDAPVTQPDAEGAVTNIALRPLGGGAVAHVAALAEGLVQKLAAWAPTVMVTRETTDAAVGAGSADAALGDERQVACGRWLDELERAYDHVVYLADAEPSGWTERCLRQADIVLDVGVAAQGARRAPGLGSALATNELILIHAASTRRPQGSAAWLAGGAYARHHHVCEGSRADLERLARRVTGRGIGVALGGGGARGLAHIGVLRALEAMGVPVDELGGTSMGAILAVQRAAGLSIDEMIALNREDWLRYRPHRSYTLPLISVVSHSGGRRMLEHMFGTLDFADTWIECFACSANLTRASLRVHRQGPVVSAVVASISIPGVAPPVVDAAGELHVDGGIINNLPAAHLRRGRNGTVIASDVSHLQERRPGYANTPSPWRLARDRLRARPRGGAPYFPSLFETLTFAATVGSASENQRVVATADLYLRPPVGSFGLFEFERIDDLVELGYRHACEQIEAWRADRESPAAVPLQAPVEA